MIHENKNKSTRASLKLLHSKRKLKIVLSIMFLIQLHFAKGEKNINSVQSLSFKETVELTIPNGNIEEGFHFTYLRFENFYEIVDQYTFYFPEVNVVCPECVCVEKDQTYCSEKTTYYENACAYLINSTSTCTIYNSFGSGQKFCEKNYRICCQVYFSKTSLFNDYKALKLKYQKSVLKLRVDFNSLINEEKSFILSIDEKVKHYLITPKTILHLHHANIFRVLPEQWYFLEDGSKVLKYSKNINQIDGTDFKKVGWFQYNEKHQQLSRPLLFELKSRLKVNVVNCAADPPLYDWNLDAVGYYSYGKLFLNIDVQKVSEAYGEIVSSMLKDDKVLAESNFPPSINISLSLASSFSYNFKSTISIFSNKNITLILTFTRGSGRFDIEIRKDIWKKPLKFLTFVVKDTNDKPVKITHPLPNDEYESSFICVSQDDKQLCNSPNIEKENFSSEKKNKLLQISTKIETESATTDHIKQGNEKAGLASVNDQGKIYGSLLLIGIFIFVLLLGVIFRKRISKFIKPIKSYRKEDFPDTESYENSPASQQEDSNTMIKTVEEIPLLSSSRQNSKREITPGKKNERVKFLQQFLLEDKMKTIFAELMMKIKNQRGEEEDVEIKKEEIFDEMKNKSPLRILIEGHPGYGKSTLIENFHYDWIEGKTYIRNIFDLVFKISLRNYSGDLENCLLQQYKGDEGREEKLKTIKARQKRVLLLLDGLDECDDKIKKSLLPLFKRLQYPNMTVIVTSRTGLFDIKSNSNQAIEEIGNRSFGKYFFWDKMIQIKGISHEQSLAFLQKFLNIQSAELKEKLSECKVDLTDFFECPLLLSILANIIKHGVVKNIESKTELYQIIFNSIINRSLVREEILDDENTFDIFDSKQDDQIGCRKLLANFSLLCLNKIKSRNEKFKKIELPDSSFEKSGDKLITKLGFLSKQISFENNREIEYYELIDRNFLEFLAGSCLFFQVQKT